MKKSMEDTNKVGRERERDFSALVCRTGIPSTGTWAVPYELSTLTAVPTTTAN